MADVTDFQACYAAVHSRDRRFDGRFVTGVLTTGIYCRPSCPARTPKPENVRFFPSPAAAQQAGLRACRRCRPELAPDAPGTDPQAEVAARAYRLIQDGAADEGVEALAARVHLSPRQLQRVMVAAYGAGPAALARMHRVRLARLLVDQTDLPLTRVAHAAGFGSVRQFNDAFRQAFHVAPSAVRRAARPIAPGGDGVGGPPAGPHPEVHPPGGSPATPQGAGGLPAGPHPDVHPPGGAMITLAIRQPFDPAGVLAWAGLHAIPSRDVVDDGSWTRVTDAGTVRMAPAEGGLALHLDLADPDADLPAAVALARQAFDTDADIHAVHAALGTDPLLGPLLAARPGVRLPGAADPVEGAVRVVLGQQVSARGATTLMGRLAALAAHPGIPDPAELAQLPLEDAIGLTRQRAGAVRSLAGAIAAGLDLSPSADPAELVGHLVALPGIGPWTAQAIALVVMRHPDAWPTGDLALRRAVGGLTGTDPTARELDAMAEPWRPWRGYAALLLWHHHLGSPGTPPPHPSAETHADPGTDDPATT